MGNIDDEINREIERIKKSIDNMDMQSINESIGETVNKALGHAARSAEQTADRISQEMDKWKNNNRTSNGYTSGNQGSPSQSSGSPYRYGYGNMNYQGTVGVKKRASVCVPPKGRVLGRVSAIAGGFFAVLFASLIFMMAALGEAVVGIAVFLPFVILGLAGMIWGIGNTKRYSRYQSYVREMGGKPFVKTENLARATGKSLKYTLKDIRNMIRDGVFPSGKLSDEEDYLMLTRAVYEDYVKARDDLRRRQREEKENQARAEREKMTQEEKKAVDEKTRQLQETIRTGREYLRQIEEANDVIETKEISEKLFRLQLVIDKIFYCVEQNPEKLPEIKQFMEYYLPTTLKLVNAYRDFYLQPVQGENITAAKTEIEKAIDTINTGFENLLDDLFKQDALDITTDIYVLENMLAREGLTENEFEKMRSGGQG